MVTNKEELNVWSPVANTFIAVTSPVIKNYTANQNKLMHKQFNQAVVI
ncbi:hypothetical protein LBGG_01577 [Lactobacillus gasseri MV-22]|nr:hypothetical protein LBGG_01577 [Lactobacillus gasseri MV-22]